MTPDRAFVEFPKIARLSREIVVTEKIDGTSGLIYIPETCDLNCVCSLNSSSPWHCWTHHTPEGKCEVIYDGDPCAKQCACAEFRARDRIYAGSRTKWITPEDDNMGFAKWVEKNRDELLALGPGNHFGEWWGKGIQRGYGVPDKRFSLFNTHRWGDGGADKRPACCGVVPVLHRGAFQIEAIDAALNRLRQGGSVAAPGFMKPEGVVVFHTAANMAFKKTIEGDAQPKGANR